MSTATATKNKLMAELEYTTFYIGDMLMGIDIQQLQEINQHTELTRVPHAAACVRGIVNLRGDVVTVLDLRTILGLEAIAINHKSRNVIVRSDGEYVGLLVDRIADVVYTRSSEIESVPANVGGIDGRFFQGVCKLEGKLMVVLDTAEILRAASEKAEELLESQKDD